MSSRPFSDGYDLRALGPVSVDINPHRYATPAETKRLVDDCLADDERADADCAEFEHRRTRRRKRKSESGGIAVVCFVCLAAMMLPSLVGRWPLETLLLAGAMGAVAGIVRGAKARSPWW